MEIPKHYSLHSDEDSHFVVHDKRDGKTFQIAKKALHPAHQIKVMKMQKFAEGGETEEAPADVNGIPYYLAENAPEPTPQSAPSSNTAEIAPPVATPQAEVAQAPAKKLDEAQQFEANQALEERGLQAKGNLEAKAGELNARAYEDTNSKINKFMEASNVPIEKLSQENDAMAQALADPKSDVDPRRYFHNLGTGGKIMNAIAMILGGMGAGLTHGPNMGMEVINNAINKDIESQKINLGKKESLLSQNLARFKDMKTAQMATYSQMNAMAQGQIAANTARYGGQAGQAMAQAALGQLKNQNLQSLTALKQQMFESQIKQHLAGGDIANDNPLDYVKHVVPPAHQQKVFDEIGVAQDATQNEPSILKAFDEASKENTILRTGAGYLREPGSVNALKQGMLPLFKDIDGTVRQAAMDETFHNLVPKPGDADAKIQYKRNALIDWLHSKKAAPTARGFGIDVNKFQNTGRSGVTSNPLEGQTASDGKGNRIVMKNGNWMPVR